MVIKFKRSLAFLAASTLTLSLGANALAADTGSTVNTSTAAVTQLPTEDDFHKMFTDAIVERSGDNITVSFDDRLTGEHYSFSYTQVNDSEYGFRSSNYTTTSTGWVLNRKETDALAREGNFYAGMYAIASGLGFGVPALFAAATEGAWGSYASSYYSHGNCIKIHYWLAVSEVKYGQKGCY